MQARRLARMTTLITTNSIVLLLVQGGLGLTIAGAIGSMFVAWHLFMAVVGWINCRATREVAHQNRIVQGDLQFSICCSVLLIMSVWQLMASFAIARVSVTGYQWSDAGEGFGAFCILITSAVSVGAAGIGSWVSIGHLTSNDPVLVCF